MFKIGNITIEHNTALGPMAGVRPALSFAVQRNGMRTAVYGNDQRKGALL